MFERKYETKFLKNKKVVARMIRQAKEDLKQYHIDISKYIFHVYQMHEVGGKTCNDITATIECACRDNKKLTINIDKIYYNKETGEILQSVLTF